MLHIKWIRDNSGAFDRGLQRRGEPAIGQRILELDAQRRAAQTRLQEIQRRRNEASKLIGKAKAAGENSAGLIAEVADLKRRRQVFEDNERQVSAALDDLLAGVPNLLADDVPDGPDEAANVELRTVGDKPQLDFSPKQHFEIGERLGHMDFELAGKLSKARTPWRRSHRTHCWTSWRLKASWRLDWRRCRWSGEGQTPFG